MICHLGPAMPDQKQINLPGYALHPEHVANIGPAIWVFLWLWNRKGEGGIVGPGEAGSIITKGRIAKDLGISERSVKRHLATLREGNYLDTWFEGPGFTAIVQLWDPKAWANNGPADEKISKGGGPMVTPPYKYRCRATGALMMTDTVCSKRAKRKIMSRTPLDEQHETEKCRQCEGAEKLDTPIPIDHRDTPPRSEAAENAPRGEAADNRLEGRRKPDCGPGPESAGPGNNDEPTPGERGSAAAPGKEGAPNTRKCGRPESKIGKGSNGPGKARNHKPPNRRPATAPRRRTAGLRRRPSLCHGGCGRSTWTPGPAWRQASKPGEKAWRGITRRRFAIWPK